jgi:hypothetical protein
MGSLRMMMATVKNLADFLKLQLFRSSKIWFIPNQKTSKSQIKKKMSKNSASRKFKRLPSAQTGTQWESTIQSTEMTI